VIQGTLFALCSLLVLGAIGALARWATGCTVGEYWLAVLALVLVAGCIFAPLRERLL